MLRVLCFGVCIGVVILIPIFASAQDAHELINAGDTAYILRSQSIDNAKTAINKWEMAFKIDPESTESLNKTCMAYCFLGRFASHSGSAKKYYEKAHTFAKQAITLDPKKAATHYWWAFSLLKSFNDGTKLEKLKIRSAVLEHLNTAKTLDPKYYFGGPDRVLGMIALTGPVPDVDMAIRHFKNSLKIEPDFSATLLLLAKAYIKENQHLKARSILQKLLDTEPKPGFEKEFNSDKKTAGQLMTSTGKNQQH